MVNVSLVKIFAVLGGLALLIAGASLSFSFFSARRSGAASRAAQLSRRADASPADERLSLQAAARAHIRAMLAASQDIELDLRPRFTRWDGDNETPLAFDEDAYSVFWHPTVKAATDRFSATNTKLVNAGDFDLPWYRLALKELKLGLRKHRKPWEFVTIYCAVKAMIDFGGKTAAGQEIAGIGFGVGTEPLASAFVAAGATRIVATDMPLSDKTKREWADSDNQHAAALEATWHKALVRDRKKYFKAATYRAEDMSNISADLLRPQFDFVWSCGALEHQGTLRLVEDYILNTARMLKPGGVAAHTSELIVSSLRFIHELPGTFVMIRAQDIERIAEKLEQPPYNARMTTRDWFGGGAHEDLRCDAHPYHSHEHFKLYRVDDVSDPPPARKVVSCHTSILIVIQKKTLA